MDQLAELSEVEKESIRSIFVGCTCESDADVCDGELCRACTIQAKLEKVAKMIDLNEEGKGLSAITDASVHELVDSCGAQEKGELKCYRVVQLPTPTIDGEVVRSTNHILFLTKYKLRKDADDITRWKLIVAYRDYEGCEITHLTVAKWKTTNEQSRNYWVTTHIEANTVGCIVTNVDRSVILASAFKIGPDGPKILHTEYPSFGAHILDSDVEFKICNSILSAGFTCKDGTIVYIAIDLRSRHIGAHITIERSAIVDAHCGAFKEEDIFSSLLIPTDHEMYFKEDTND